MKRLTTMVVAAVCGLHLSAQTFTTEFSAEMMKTDGKMEVAPQLKGILELPLGKAWGIELELASAQAGLDFRADAKRALTSTLSLLGGVSSGDACQVYFADLGIAVGFSKTSYTAIMHYAPFSGSHDKYLELTAQRDFGCLYIQPGIYVNHFDSELSLTAILTVGITLDI